jgi:PAS domain S-box-containing protein
LKIWPLVVLLCSFVGTGFIWWNAKVNAEAELRLAFEHQVDDFTSRLQQQLAAHESLLMGFSGIFNVSEQVTRQEFHNYYEAMHFNDKDSGFAAMAYHEIVQADKIKQFLAQQRLNGNPDYHISPAGVRNLYAPLIYIEPFTENNRKVLGFDPYTIPAERLAIERARDTESVAISSKLSLAQDAGQNITGFVMYLPIYKHVAPHATKAERQANFVGWVDAPFRMSAFIAHSIPVGLKNIDVEIFDGQTLSPENLFYDSNGIKHSGNYADLPLTSRQQISFGGHTWNLAFYADAGYGSLANQKMQQLVGLSGLLFSVLLSVMVAFLILLQRRRVMNELRISLAAEEEVLEAQRQQTEKILRENEWALNEAQRIAQVGTYFTDITTGLWQGSVILDNIFGIDSSFEKTIHNWNSLVAPEQRQELLDYYESVIHGDGQFDKDYKVIRPLDGEIRWVSALGEFVFDANGNPVTLKGTIQDISVRKQAEIHLAEREEIYRKIVNQAQDGILLIDIDTLRFIEFNDAACISLGYSREEFAQLSLADIQGTMNAAEVSAQSLSMFELGQAGFDTLHRHKNGMLRNIMVSTGAVRISGRRNLVSIHTDITQLKATERELLNIRDHLEERVREQTAHLQQIMNSLQVSEQKHRHLIEHSHDIIYTLDPEGVFTFISPSLTLLLGHPVEHLVNHSLAEFIHPNDLGLCLATVHKVVAKGERIHDIEHRIMHTDGHWRWFSSNVVPLTNEAGKVIGVQGSANDITDRRLAEISLREMQEKLKSMTDSVPGVVYQFLITAGGEWKYIYVSKGIQELYEISAEEACRNHHALFECILPEDRDSHRMSVERAFRLLSDWSHEHRIKSRNGNIKWIRGLATIHPQPDGSAIWSGLLTDITERKHIEESALAANRAKSAFLANMSHEIRTPMNGVIGMADVLLNTPLTERQKRMMQIIRESAKTQLNILNDILDFSKIEAGKMALFLEPLSVADLVVNTCAILVSQATQQKCRLTWNVDPKVPKMLQGDVLRLRQILTNFVTNAMKFSSGLERPGIVTVSATVFEQSAEQVWIEIGVCDNGIGMNPDVQASLFQAFQQGDSTTTRLYGGTGLGLVISRRFAEMMGGEIKVQSTPGEGSTFTLRVPLIRVNARVANEIIAAAPLDLLPELKHVAPSRAEALQQGRLILVAEDNETNQEVIREQLGLLGFTCDIAADGRKAFERWLSGDYGLVLSDIHMPHMDGYQLLLAIRQEEVKSGHHTPIVALTANALKDESERCKALGMDGCITKPAQLSELSAMLNKWLPALKPAAAIDVVAAQPAPVEAGSIQPAPLETAEFPVWDDAALTRMVGNNPDMHLRLLKKFLQNAQQQISAILNASESENAVEVGQVAHALKSAARTVGAMQLGDLCQQLETAGKANDPLACGALAEGLHLVFAAVTEKINHRLNGSH